MEVNYLPEEEHEEIIEKKIKKKIPINVQRHKDLCIELNKTYERKNHDYGNSFSDTYKSLGIAAALVRISDKYNRMMSLGSGKKQMVNNESLRDTLMDMANYSLMTVLELDREKYLSEKKNRKEE